MQAGSLADWVNAAGTLCTFGGAVFAGVVAWRSFRTQRAALAAEVARTAAESRERQATERRAQAALVAVWAFRSERSWYVDLANGSALPVYGLAVRAVGPGVDVVVLRGTQGPTAPRRSDSLTSRLRSELVGAGVDPASGEVSVELAFADAAGRHWHRSADGALVEVAADFALTAAPPVA